MKTLAPIIKWLPVKFKHGKVSPDRIADLPVWRQFVKEAGFDGSMYQLQDRYDLILQAAGKHDYGFTHLSQ